MKGSNYTLNFDSFTVNSDSITVNGNEITVSEDVLDFLLDNSEEIDLNIYSKSTLSKYMIPCRESPLPVLAMLHERGSSVIKVPNGLLDNYAYGVDFKVGKYTHGGYLGTRNYRLRAEEGFEVFKSGTANMRYVAFRNFRLFKLLKLKGMMTSNIVFGFNYEVYRNDERSRAEINKIFKSLKETGIKR